MNTIHSTLNGENSFNNNVYFHSTDVFKIDKIETRKERLPKTNPKLKDNQHQYTILANTPQEPSWEIGGNSKDPLTSRNFVKISPLK